MNWDAVQRLFDSGREQSPQEREALLKGAAPEQADAVRSLWANHDDAGSFLNGSLITGMVAGSIGRDAAEARQPGTRIAGRFTLAERLGAGGMGEVFSARDETLGRVVALKFVRPDLAASEHARTRLEREARALCALAHPNVCTVHDLVWDASNPALVMERMDGETLAARLTRGRLAADELIPIATAVLNALAYIHRAGVVHRDLKPANVMLTPTGPKIFDFGIASVISGDAPTTTVTSAGRLVGSVSYMSPEQVSGQTVDARSDIFAFGCLLYEMVSGRRAFARDTELATLAAVLETTPQPIQELAPDVSARVAAVIATCLEKDPARRFQAATQILDALGDSAAPESRTRVGRASPHGQTWRRAAAMVAGVVVLASVGVFYVARDRGALRGTPRDSVAVLPFSGPGNDADVDYIADGLAESVTNSLSKLSGVRVAPRSKAFAYKGDRISVEEAGRALGVQTIVMGRVARAGTKFRVQAELIDIERGTQLWGQQFEGGETDLLRIQGELTQMVSQRLTATKGEATAARLQAGSTVDPKAYQAYLRGRYAQFTLGDYAKALAHFREALAIDPNYALAYAGVAISYVDGPPVPTMTRAKAAALRALDIDPTLAEGHLALGMILGWYEFDWVAAEQSLKRALDLQPNDALTRLYYGWLLLHTGRGNEGIGQGQVAFGLDPLNPYVEMAYAQMHYACGQPKVAVERLRSLLSASDFNSANWGLGYAHLMLGEWRDAISTLELLRTLDPELEPSIDSYEAFAYKQLGDEGRTRQLLSEAERSLERLSPQLPSTAYLRATFAAVAGEREKALEWLRRAVAERDSTLPFNLASIDPLFVGLRPDPRYLAITTPVTRAGLSPCQPQPSVNAR
jgi:serine/threonine protein kinase/tetratricopeptide (TPR) repeat protein